MKATADVLVLSSGIYRATVSTRAASARAVGATPRSAIRAAISDLVLDGHKVRSIRIRRADCGLDYADAQYVGRTFATNGGAV